MSKLTESFLLSLEEREAPPLPPHIRGTLRIDLVAQDHTERWFVTMAAGRVTVSRQEQPVDAVFTTTPDLFDRLVRGETPTIAALLRNAASFAAPDARLIMAFQRLFPSAADAEDPRSVVRRQAPHGERWRRRLEATLDRRATGPS